MEQSDRFIDTRSDRLDHWLFVIIFVVGVVPAFVVRFFFAYSAYFTMIWLVGVMFTYFWLIVNTRRFRMREDKSADNLYFLGFLFTVSALITSLIKFSQNTGTDGQIANNPLVVVEDLGIGLVTTLVGLLLRVFISQLRQDPEEIEEEVRLTLAEVSERVQGDVIATGEMIESARLLSAQVLEESSEILKEQQKLSRDAMTKFRKVFESGSEKFIASSEDLCGRIDSIDIREEMFSEKLDRPIAELERSIRGFSARIHRLEIPSNLLRSQTEEAIAAVRETVTSTIAKEMRELKEHVGASISDSIENLEKEMAVLIGNIEVPPELLSEQLKPATQSIAVAFEEFEAGTTPLLEKFTLSVKESLSRLQDFQISQTEQLSELTVATQAARESFGDASARITARIDQALDQISDSFKQIADELGSDNVARFQEMTSQHQEQLLRLQASVDAVAESAARFGEQVNASARPLNGPAEE